MLLSAGLAFAIVGGCQASSVPEPVTLAELDRLVALYKELHLPIPPADAPLVAYGRSDWRVNNRMRHFVRCGYLIPGTQPDGVQIMIGTVVSTPYPTTIEPIPLLAISANEIDLNGFETGSSTSPFAEDFAPGMAVIERIRGHDTFALAILRRTAAGNSETLVRSTRLAWPLGFADCERRLHYLALQHWANEIFDPKANRGVVLQELASLVTRFPELGNTNVAEMIAGLRATVSDRYHGSDKIERLIDSLCDQDGDGDVFETVRRGALAKRESLLALVSYGYQAVPHLISHGYDKRLTRAVRGPMGSFVTVGEVCVNVAQQFSTVEINAENIGSPVQALKDWWSLASLRSDRDNCLSALERPDRYLPEAAIKWAQHRSPDLLLDAYDNVLNHGRETETNSLLSAMRASKLGRAAIVSAAVKGLQSKYIDQEAAAIATLQKLDRTKADDALTVMLERIPSTSKNQADPYREVVSARLACSSRSPNVWSALATATRRADVDLRLEMIGGTAFARDRGRVNALHVEYLSGFLSDTSEAAPAKPTREHRLPKDEHFFLLSPRVQDLAAGLAGRELGIKEIPNKTAPRATWDAFRSSVQMRIAKTLQAH
jgi:hypothetical protein